MNYYSVEESAPSPASSISQMSVGSDPSPAPSPSCPSPHSPQNPFRYRMSESLELVRAEETVLPPPPKPTHVSEYDSVQQKQFERLVEQRNYQGLENLLRSSGHRININQYDAVGQTPVQRFSASGDLQLVQLMVRYGADTQICSRDGWALLHYATQSGVHEVLMYVLRCCARR